MIYGNYSFPISIWARILELPEGLIYKRLRNGWTDREVILTDINSDIPNPIDRLIQIPQKYLCINRISIKEV